MQRVCSLLTRLDNVITFSLIRFLYRLLNAYINEHGILLLCSLGLCMCKWAAVVGVFSVDELRRILALLWSQNTINLVTSHNRLVLLDSAFTFELLQQFTAATALIVVGSIAGDFAGSQLWFQQCITLLLFMYAEATQKLVTLLNMGQSVVFVCVLLYFICHRFRPVFETWSDARTLVQALQMICINVIISKVYSTAGSSMATITGMLLIILFIIDALAGLLDILTESRDYALWKVSSRLSAMYATEHIPSVVSGSVFVVLLCINSHKAGTTQTMLELALLVLLNSLIDDVTSSAFELVSVTRAVAGFAYLVVFHSILRFLRPA
jgi:hypothetical protein